MSFILEVSKVGKDFILFGNDKYRESYSVKSGELVWRCLGRNCKASIRTNKEKTVICSSNGSHNGPHPVTMRALQTPSPTTSQRKRCSAPAETDPPCATTYSGTPDVNNATDLLAHSNQLASVASDLKESPSNAETQGVFELRQENTRLRDELAKLRVERQTILDHSIESDTRLLQYTEDVFLGPASMTSMSSLSSDQREALRSEDDLEIARMRIQELEETITQLRRPCEQCRILREETNNIIESLRILENENLQLKNNISSHSLKVSNSTFSAGSLLHNNVQVLEDEDHSKFEDDFTTVVRKKNRRKKKSNAALSKNKKQKKNIAPKSFLTAPFSNVTILGDSHVRNLALILREILSVDTAISGVCKPGASLLNIIPTSAPPSNHCYVLMAGTNDVDAGQEDVIFGHLDNILSKMNKDSRVLIVPLTTRHDLDNRSPVHDIINLVNNYMDELCHRHRGVEILNINSIGRHYYTSHGLHLRASGKKILASLIAERLACMTPVPRPRSPLPRPALARITPPLPVPIPFTLQYGSYAEAVAQSSSPNTLSRNRENYTANEDLMRHCNDKPPNSILQAQHPLQFLPPNAHNFNSLDNRRLVLKNYQIVNKKLAS